MVAPYLPDPEKLAAVRAGLPALAAGIYLNTGSAGPLPAETDAAMREIEARELTAGRGHPRDFADALDRADEARAAAAVVVGAELDTIALTHSTTDGMNAVAWAVDWQPGDRAITTNHEHPGGLGPLLALRERLGVAVDIVDVGDGGDDQRTLSAIEAALRSETRLVALSHVLWTTGALLPIAAIVELAHAAGARVLVDGAQAAGAIPVDVASLGVDAYALPGQKWLLGPSGMGALFVARAALPDLRPAFTGYRSYERIDRFGEALVHPDARRFESTNFRLSSIVGFARSCGWLSMFVGLDWVLGRGPALARAAADRLAAIPGVTVLTPRDRMATLVSFRIDGWSPEAALEELGARAFAILRTMAAMDALRISVGAFNSEVELDRFAEAVELLAAHTPETLPSRRLTILGPGS